MISNTENQVPAFLFGIGKIVDPDTGDEFEHFSEVKLSSEIQNFITKSSKSYDDIVIPTGRNFKGSIAIGGITIKLLQKMLGGDYSTDEDNVIKTSGNGTVAAETFVVDLGGTPRTGTLTIWHYVDGEKIKYVEVDEDPTGDQFTLLTDTATFAATCVADVVYFDFLEDETAGADQLSFGPDSALPAQFAMEGMLEMRTADGTLKNFHWYAKKCKIDGAIDITAPVQGNTPTPIPFNISTENAGDFVIKRKQ